MKVYTYFESILDDQKLLVDLWAKSWRNFSFEPVVLTEADARRHPDFGAYYGAISRLPTINNPAYERACFLRWLALEQIGTENKDAASPLFLTDYDVINYGLGEGDIFSHDLTCYERSIVPCAVSGSLSEINRLRLFFQNWQKPENVNHVSDQEILRGELGKHIRVQPEVVEVGDKLWHLAKAVHFATAPVQRSWFFPKHKCVSYIRPVK